MTLLDGERRHLIGWQDFAECRGYPAEIFYGFDRERPPARARREAMAVALCNSCVVRPACAEAGADERWGIWGGLLEGERGFDRLGTRVGAGRGPVPGVRTTSP